MFEAMAVFFQQTHVGSVEGIIDFIEQEHEAM